MAKQYGDAYRTIRLCVDSYDKGVMKGRYCHPGMEDAGRSFESLTQFLSGTEGWMDEANYPQAYTARRSFAPVMELKEEAPGEAPQTGALGTFVIRIMFRQHASWQGSVTWLEGKGEQTFRSVLELILLLDSALGGCREGGEPS